VVAPIENLTRIRGTITSRRPHPSLPGWDVVTVDVDAAEPVPGMRDLLASRAGSGFEVAVPRALLGSAGPGAQVSCRAKLTPNGAMCEPHPKPGDFSVSAS
jgi:hypothetical protein